MSTLQFRFCRHVLVIKLIFKDVFRNSQVYSLVTVSYENALARVISNSSRAQQCAYVDDIKKELIESCVNDLKLGKACGPDDDG